MAPEEGFEPSTNRLTAGRSTTELLGIANLFFDQAVNPDLSGLYHSTTREYNENILNIIAFSGFLVKYTALGYQSWYNSNQS